MLLMEDRMPIAGDIAPEDKNDLKEGRITSAGETLKKPSERSQVYLIRCPLNCSHCCGNSDLVIPDCSSDEDNSDDEDKEYGEELESRRRKQKRKRIEKEDIPVLVSTDATVNVSQHFHVHHHYHCHHTSPSSPTTTRFGERDITHMVPPSCTTTTPTTTATLICRGVADQLPQPPTTTTITPTTHSSWGAATQLPQSRPQLSQQPSNPHTPQHYRTKAIQFFLAQLQLEGMKDAGRMKEIKELINRLENQVFTSVASQKEYQYMLAKRLARIQMQLNSYNSNRNTRQQGWDMNEQVR